jgi:hypothetical protein
MQKTIPKAMRKQRRTASAKYTGPICGYEYYINMKIGIYDADENSHGAKGVVLFISDKDRDNEAYKLGSYMKKLNEADIKNGNFIHACFAGVFV